MSQWGADFMHLGSISFLYVMNKIPDELRKFVIEEWLAVSSS